MKTGRPYDPMTIANAVELGLTGAILCCRKCQREGQASFDDLALPADTPVPSIARTKRFVRSSCGNRSVVSLPDWKRCRAPGMGGLARSWCRFAPSGLDSDWGQFFAGCAMPKLPEGRRIRYFRPASP